ncbi:MAG: AIM24 family protein [Armatimonadota bacterium]
MAVPVLLATAANNESYGGVTYHIEGELVPVLHIELSAVQVYFEHHILLWKDPQVGIGLHPLKGAFKRMLAGMPIVMTETQGQGRIAFSRDGAGHVFAIHLAQGQAVDVREHQFMAATTEIDYTFTRVKGAANIFLGGQGFFMDTFSCRGQQGILWLHGYGNVFEVTLAPGEQIDIEPGGWIYKDPSVRMDTITQRLAAGILAGTNFFWNRFTGPGKIALQSMYMPIVPSGGGSS